jgi:hypothetical protein
MLREPYISELEARVLVALSPKIAKKVSARIGLDLTNWQAVNEACRKRDEDRVAYEVRKITANLLRRAGTDLPVAEYSSTKAKYPAPVLRDAVLMDRSDKLLPAKSGVYFVWANNTIQYVGQSINLSQRVRLAHQNIAIGDLITYIEFPPEELNFAESYYIGICRPCRNFGLRTRDPVKDIDDFTDEEWFEMFGQTKEESLQEDKVLS